MSSAAVATSSQTITGTIERVVYQAADTGWAVLSVQPGHGPLTTCVGTLFEEPATGQEYEFTGEWSVDPKYGKQFRFVTATPARPTTTTGIEKYLASGVLDGVGPALAGRIVATFGADTLQVMDDAPEMLLEITGIGQKKYRRIAEQWELQSRHRDLVVWLLSLGITVGMCGRIIRHFTKDELDPREAILSNPYSLTAMFGVGFKRADQIARKIGFALDDPRRLRAGMVYTLACARDGAGHCYLPEGVAISETAKLCEVDAAKVRALPEDLAMLQEIVRDDDRLYLPVLAYYETTLARDLSGLAAAPLASRHYWPEERLQAQFEQQVGYRLTGEQLAAVYALLGARLGVLTGGPGVGKTAITRAIVMAAEAAGMTVALASPTGRAAKRLEELTDHSASTVHRLLQWSHTAQQFSYDHDTPLPFDLVIVDEASMVDLPLAYALCRAVNPLLGQLLFVGDEDQLPSVGPGAVLGDVIRSGRARVCRLTQIMRQAEGSGIVRDAHAINRGEMPGMDWHDCTFHQAAEPERLISYLLSYARQAARAGQELQVLSPMRRGPVGTGELNRVLQDALNPPEGNKPELVRRRGEESTTYRLGDRVIQTKNDYDRDVMNGDIGRVVAVNIEDKEVVIEFAQTTATYGIGDLGEVSLAYALTIHKAQGSEYPVVVIVASKSHYIMLQRNLLYTALTRAQRQAVVIGDEGAVSQCVSNDRSSRRHTWLEARLVPGGDARPHSTGGQP